MTNESIPGYVTPEDEYRSNHAERIAMEGYQAYCDSVKTTFDDKPLPDWGTGLKAKQRNGWRAAANHVWGLAGGPAEAPKAESMPEPQSNVNFYRE